MIHVATNPNSANPAKTPKATAIYRQFRLNVRGRSGAEKPAYDAQAAAFGPVDLAVSADHEVVEIIDEFGVAGFGAGGREVGRRPTVKFTELPHFHPGQAPYGSAVEHGQQVFESLPVVLVVIEKAVHVRRQPILGAYC